MEWKELANDAKKWYMKNERITSVKNNIVFLEPTALHH
jgi:hypothetical protein